MKGYIRWVCKLINNVYEIIIGNKSEEHKNNTKCKATTWQRFTHQWLKRSAFRGDSNYEEIIKLK